MKIVASFRMLYVFAMILVGSPILGQPISVTEAFDMGLLVNEEKSRQLISEDNSRRRTDDPIDYSELLKPAVFQRLLGHSLYNCTEGLRYCNRNIFRWSGDSLPLKIYVERGALVREDFGTISEVFERTVGAAGFYVPAEKNPDVAKIILNIGSVPYLASEASKEDDHYGAEFFERMQEVAESKSLWQLFWDRDEVRDTCYVSTKDRWTTQKVSVYLEKSGIESCLPRALMVVLGLNETSIGMPTVTDISGDFTALTYADRLLLGMLYSDEFPLDSGIEPIKLFWDQNFLEISSSISGAAAIER